MLHRLLLLRNGALATSDQKVARVKDFLVDEGDWHVRYLIVDPGPWPLGRRRLISPLAVVHIDWDKKTIQTSLSSDQLKEGPGLDTEIPLTREREIEIFTYYGWPAYWPAGHFTSVPPAAPPEYSLRPVSSLEEQLAAPEDFQENPPLRPVSELTALHLLPAGMDPGRLDDLLVTDSWIVRFLVLRAGGRLLPFPADRFEWPEKGMEQAAVDLPPEAWSQLPDLSLEKGLAVQDEQLLREYFTRFA